MDLVNVASNQFNGDTKLVSESDNIMVSTLYWEIKPWPQGSVSHKDACHHYSAFSKLVAKSEDTHGVIMPKKWCGINDGGVQLYRSLMLTMIQFDTKRISNWLVRNVHQRVTELRKTRKKVSLPDLTQIDEVFGSEENFTLAEDRPYVKLTPPHDALPHQIE